MLSLTVKSEEDAFAEISVVRDCTETPNSECQCLGLELPSVLKSVILIQVLPEAFAKLSI